MRYQSLIAATALGCTVVGFAASTGHAATTTGSGGNGSFTLSIADQQADPDGTTTVPVTLSWVGAPSVDRVVVDLDAIPVGSASVDSGIFEYKYDASSGSLTDTFSIDSGVGQYRVTGTVTLDGTTEVVLPVSNSFTLTPAPSAIGLTVAKGRDQFTFSGKATTQSPTMGTVGADSRVSIQALKSGTWSEIDYAYTDQFGNYSTTLYSWQSSYKGLSGSPVRAVLAGTKSFPEATSNEVHAGPSPAAVNVSAVAGGNKLRVDVDPNKGKGYWTFRVEKQNSAGAWKRVGTYRTSGSTEVRTLNLSKGTYRVHVTAKYGHGAVTSNPVTLNR